MADINSLDDKIAADAFRRLVRHLRHRKDAQNVDLMGLAGFCRNCLSDWIQEASEKQGESLDKDAAREIIYGMPYAEWKKNHQAEASAEQLQRMQESMKLNPLDAELDEALDESFPASDPPAVTRPG
ncbi:DUF1244 domain-containing protein [Stakelama pacifica]|uniref:SMc04008-like domain-containing protein n=1 Tax=Stakelama pacifica TaxID=517720 RepID=A0A4R6FDL4_9SPHN|nr:DUF1244 domain-containing protein [Stakelama pacifica]TDN79252.1 hypothetical protein EV664_11330 [Stakelama pacifica]GGO98603.1 hypothetical protein GCM10011329_30170 [Stakelama pacifica]